MIAEITRQLIDVLVVFGSRFLVPTMIFVFGLGIILRVLIYITMRREDWFAREFEKRVHGFIETADNEKDYSFFVVAKRLLEKTYYELFEVRAIMQRRKPDKVTSLVDRLFLIQTGCARLVRDSLKQLRFLRHSGEHPKFNEISKNVFENNKPFNSVFGVIPASLFHDVLVILPGIFIIGGIFGTFLGIMEALPELAAMDVANVEDTQARMGRFLDEIRFAMSTSIIGIILSVIMTFLNTTLSPEKLFVGVVNRFENSMDILWNGSTSNTLPEKIPDFDEHKDPIEALAEQAVDAELAKGAPKEEAREAS